MVEEVRHCRRWWRGRLGGWNPESRHKFVEMESHGHVDSDSF